MKIYTVTFDTATLSPARIWVAPYSQFAVGVKVFVNGTEAEGAVTLKKDGAAIPAEASKTGGFTVFQTKSGDTGSAEYEISVEGLSQKMKLVQVTTDSTVFDIDNAGGDMSDYYTKEQADALLSAKADESDLSDYATTDSLTAYAETGDLTAFYPKSETSSAAEIFYAMPPSFVPETQVEYVDGTLSSFSVTGQFQSSSVPEIGNAKKIVFGTAVSSIKSNTFKNCSNLEYIAFPDTISSMTIESRAFESAGLKRVVGLGDASTTLNTYAFSKMRQLDYLKIGGKIKSIPDYCFQDSLIKKITIPLNVETIASNAFVTYMSGGRTGVVFFEGRTMNDVSSMADYPWGLNPAYTVISAELTPEQTWTQANFAANLSGVSGIMKISQADYDALSAGGTADANTLYVIV